jgi:hypothetical protein
MDVNDRLTRLERAVIQLQFLALENEGLIKGKDEKEAIRVLGELTAAMSAEHGTTP